ncbi:sensor histidine kinase [Desulfohalovibrio reitneri]|uniref:sensor histidine kinase n=1 Tax=Desulfohalovibrio reitneri TaxID=1307759 RepID=UPI00068FFDC9|nr:ATP-binding protein [Desulfohalovibrio reitneri]
MGEKDGTSLRGDLRSLKRRVDTPGSEGGGEPLRYLDGRDFLARIINTSPVGIAVCDTEGQIVFANSHAEAILGLLRDGNGEGYEQPAWTVTDLDGAPAPEQGLPCAEVLQAGEAVENMERVVRWPDGRRSLLSINGSPLANRSGGLDGVVFAVSDVTEPRRTREELAREAAKLSASNEELQQFVFIVSHDLQEPLRSITGFLQLIRKRLPDLNGDVRRYMDKTIAAAARLQDLINDLLRYSRVTTHGAELAPVDTDAVLDGVIRDMESSFREHDAEITRDHLPGVLADAVQLRSVFANLLSNALKFRSAEPPRIHVSAADDGDMVRVTVLDNGIGLDPAYAEKIFGIFKKLHPPSTYSGTGLGLALCHKIIHRHGGTMRVDSRPGQGAAFSFTLPQPGDHA